MVINNGCEGRWGSRRIYTMMLMSQIMGLPIFVGLANMAVSGGAAAFLVAHAACCLAAGIPLLYMELVIGQFTARDCIDVWKARPCLAHVGYIVVLLQLHHVIYNHLLTSFVFHFLLISFESPIPYFTCGRWATENCNILVNNFTVNDDCIRMSSPPSYCNSLFLTFPEYQHWRYNILGVSSATRYQVAWRVCLASALICIIIYCSVVKSHRTVRWVVQFFTLFPIIGYLILLVGSMPQKGIVMKYDDALDSDMSGFLKEFRVSQIVGSSAASLGLGTGVALNLASSGAFRAPVYGTAVVSVVAVVAAGALVTCLTAMMSCPYAYEYGINPTAILKTQLSLLFEKTPRFLYEYQYRYFFLVLTYSCHASLGIGSNIIFILHLVDMAIARSTVVAKYPGLASFFFIACIFFVTMPLLNYDGARVLITTKRYSYIFSMFITVIEIVVFVIWYGLEKFSEDVHFMLGLQPKSYMKICWVLSTIILTYAFLNEAYEQNKLILVDGDKIDYVCWYMIVGLALLVVFIFALQLLIAACRKKFHEVLRLEPKWGPKSEVLQRSRAMFTAQAMTKEYLYRQYHLQAGILARQRVSNCRAPPRHS